MPIYSSRHRSGLFHPDGTLGVSALQGFFLARSRAISSMCALPSWHFLRPVMLPWRYRPSAPRLAQLAFASRPSFAFRAFSSPRVRTAGVRVYALPTAVSLLGFCLLTVFPSFLDETDFAASPLSHFAEPRFPRFPWGAQPVGALAFHSWNAVALSLSRPPDRCEVSRHRASRCLKSRWMRAHFFASSSR